MTKKKEDAHGPHVDVILSHLLEGQLLIMDLLKELLVTPTLQARGAAVAEHMDLLKELLE